jgi:hypothetical protein
MAPICTRALRRGLDERYELMVLKALAEGRNTEIGERAYECVRGPSIHVLPGG